MIHILERTKHGALARGQKARAEQLAAVSVGVEAKIRIMKGDVLAAIYTADTAEALRRYREHLADAGVRLEERRKNALVELEAYEVADLNLDSDSGADDGDRGGRRQRAGAMVDIAQRYGALLKEAEGVRMEIQRLGG